MMKQLLLLMMTLPVAANALAAEVEIDGLWYEIVSKTKEAKVIQYKNDIMYSGNIVIPETVEYGGANYNVTSIGDRAFSGCSGLTSIIISGNVTSIGSDAFYNNTALSSITIPSCVKSIGGRAFSGCSSLTSITIPSSVTEIGWYAFQRCRGLTSVTIQHGVTNIGNRTFEECSGLTTIIIPNSVTTIGEGVFAGCSGLTSVTIPESVTSIGNAAFAACSGLISVTIPESVTSIGEHAFQFCSSLITITIPNSVTIIGGWAFYYCNSLASIIIPDSVTSIGFCAFSGCSNLKSIKISGSVTSIKDQTFMGCSALVTIMIPSSVKSIDSYAFEGCSSLTSITISSGVEAIGDQAFANCPELTDVYCYAKEVPSSNSNIFEGSYIGYATLHVLQSSITAYKEIEPWKNFKKIVKIVMPEYALTYLLDGEVYKTYKIEEGSSIIPEAEPTKEGYTFSGWSEIPETMPAHDVTVTGSFTINQYKLIYVVDGQQYKSLTLNYGEKITPEAYPEKEGYTFSGWSEIPATMPAHDVTVTGTFTVNKYKLTYVVDGQVYKETEVNYGAAITSEPVPTKEGYTFSGWSEIPTTMPAHDVTITGSFTVNKYLLTYIVDGEEYKTYEVEYGAAITPEPEPTKEGFVFSGWNGLPETMPAHVVIVTGTFSKAKYMLTYMVDGEVYKSQEMDYGATITPEPVPTKEGHTFSGWSEIPATMPAHDVTVTGSFSVNKYILTYILDGKEYKTMEVEYGAVITPEPDPEKEGYTFSGWIGLPEIMPAKLVIVTGTFSINSYTLTYMIDEEVYKQVVYEYGAAIIPEPQPESDYVSFEWVGEPETMPAHDVTVTAVYETGIAEIIMMAQQGQVRIYSPNGKLLSKLQKGLNIVVMQDETTKKIVVK